jgi:hypothetical protein
MIPAVLRMAFSLSVLATCGGLVAACGGGGGGPIAKTRAEAFANAVNLRSGDLPGMGILVPDFETRNGPLFGSCTTHLNASDEIVGAESPWFLRSSGQRRVGTGVIVGRPPVEGVHSIVYVMRDAGLASGNLAAARGAAAPACVERVIVKDASEQLVRGEPYKREIRVTSLPFPIAGVAGYGFRVRGTLAAAVFHQKKRSAFYEDTFGFAVGPAEIVLHTDGATRAFPSVLEQHLLSLLYDRAKARPL